MSAFLENAGGGAANHMLKARAQATAASVSPSLVFEAYTPSMDTTIKVDTRVRDRLAQLARDRGTTIRDLVTELAAATPTQAELSARAQAATAYVREHINPQLTDADLAAGEMFWTEVEAGRLPNMADLYRTDQRPAR
jgi:hypothetical protein